MQVTKLYIDQAVTKYPEVLSIKSCLKVPFQIVNTAREVYQDVASATDPIQKGKETLYLTKNKGAFIRDCPGTRTYTCCGYRILHIGTFCTMDCAYCILQAYYHPPVLQFFVNRMDLEAELKELFAEKTVCRIGTGEFTDSLIWEQWSDLSRTLIKQFGAQNHAVLELKTKTTSVNGLEFLPHNRKTIIAWSLNTEAMIRIQEKSTASLSARLKAAARCESWGYPLAFHFDPMIIYQGCEADYRAVVEQIFTHVSAKNIAWISLGSFRFMPALKPIIQNRFPESKIVYGEFISGLDGKMRYFKPLRIDLYRRVAAWIREIAPDVLVYFCMEDDEVWQKSLGFLPNERGGLSHMLDESAKNHSDLNKG
jgi:spore photoproduct lyase